jgi:hypothetical protein
VGRVVIGMDPHKRSATIEVMDSDEIVLGRARYGTHQSGYRAMVRAVWQHCQRVGGLRSVKAVASQAWTRRSIASRSMTNRCRRSTQD